MKKVLLILMCALMLVSVTACEDKVKDKEDKKTEETKMPQDSDDKDDDKVDLNLGGNLGSYVDKSKEAKDDLNCDYVKSAVAAGATVEEAYEEMSRSDGKKWILITFDDGMTISSEEDFTALKVELNEILYDLSAPKVEGKVGYLVTWISDTGKLNNFNAETVDATTADSYMKASSHMVANDTDADNEE